jgi:hypothetical protein
MKHIILTTAIFLMITLSNRSSAQSSNDAAVNITSLLSANIVGRASAVKVTEVNARAMKDFNRSFKHAPETKWFQSDKGYFASFDEDGKNTKIVYDNKGRRNYTIISYPEAKLDRHIRTLVKSTYLDATIIGVHEFELDSKTVYAIKMLDQNSRPLTLKVSDGQIEDITSHAKN